jgi:diguanylate cyclase (GGDEF)-like protein
MPHADLHPGRPGGAKRRPSRAGNAARVRLAAKALDLLPLSVAVIGRNLRLHYWNMHCAELLNLPFILEADPPTFTEALGAAKRATPRQLERISEFCAHIMAGNERAEPSSWLRVSLSRHHRVAFKLHPIGGDRWLLGIEDLHTTGQTQAAASDAMIDALTGLSNRRHFNETLRDVIRVADSDTHHAVVVIDLDRFKTVNDTLGHSVGDALLCLVAQRLRRETRDEDIVARLGGDEFVILLPNGEMAEVVAARVVEILSRPFLVEGHVANIGASVGVARYPDHGTTDDELMRHADLALYDAKGGGRGTWRCFNPAMAEQARGRQELETDLRKALMLGEFTLAYQPQVNVETQTLTGFEALLRWNHPFRGAIPPATFIPIAEEIGCITALGEWVLRAACREAAGWPAPLSVAVNVSPKQFADPDRLFAAVQAALDATGLPADRLELEITESAILSSETAVAAVLHRIRALGVHIAMDDFGTGYSSLSQLRSFPFDKIKIDRSFVAGLDGDADGAAVIRAITTLGAGLGMTTIAEGVETTEQASLVTADGCANIQGYLISRPVPAAEVPALISSFGDGKATS